MRACRNQSARPDIEWAKCKLTWGCSRKNVFIVFINMYMRRRNINCLHRFLPRDAMQSADYAVERCPSILSVCLSHAGILSKRLNISSNIFSASSSHISLVFAVPNVMAIFRVSDGDPYWKRRMQGRMNKKLNYRREAAQCCWVFWLVAEGCSK